MRTFWNFLLRPETSKPGCGLIAPLDSSRAIPEWLAAGGLKDNIAYAPDSIVYKQSTYAEKVETMAKSATHVLEPELEPAKSKRTLNAKGRRHIPASQPEREIFARNIRAARVELHLTQRDLSKLTGIAQAHISQMEGAMHNVCIDTMVTLSRYLKKPLSKLFEI